MTNSASEAAASSDGAGQHTPDPQSVEGLFLAALAVERAEDRAKFLDEACGDNADQRMRVEALLRAYDDAGSLIFSGGVTPGRGHEGHSRAANDLVNKINGRFEVASHWPVYGCLIIEPGSSP